MPMAHVYSSAAYLLRLQFGLTQESTKILCFDRAGQEEGTKWVHGWEAQLALILATSRGLPFAKRTPVAAWRGRHEGGRDWLRCDPSHGVWELGKVHNNFTV